MGCCCLGKQVKMNEETKKIFQSDKIPSDEFLCSKCSEFIPEILSIQIDNMKINFECKKCSKIKESYDDYQSKLYNHNYFYIPCYYCKQTSRNNEDFFLYCYDCRKEFCTNENCQKDHEKEHEEENKKKHGNKNGKEPEKENVKKHGNENGKEPKKENVKKHGNENGKELEKENKKKHGNENGKEPKKENEIKHELEKTKNKQEKIIKVNEKKKKCLKHYGQEVNKFCKDCKENICKLDLKRHKYHKINELSDFEKDLNKNKAIIEEKNEKLLKIIGFNEALLNAFDKHKYNYFYLKSLKNIYYTLQREKDRDSNDLPFLLNDFENKIKNSKKASNSFFIAKKKDIKREEDKLIFIKEKINDENIKCISQIKFNNLKVINLSGNEITNIKLLCNISLPYLELLNLSENKIVNIAPLGQLNSLKLKYLFIQKNQIEDIQVFIDYYELNFKYLEILRLDENKIDDKSNSYEEFEKLYDCKNNQNDKGVKDVKDNIIITSSYIDKISQKYNINYNENSTEIELKGTEESNLILRKLFIIISQKNKNKIQKLNLSNNKIVNPSLLNLIQFDFLEELDLSQNQITNLNFIERLNAENLTRLILNNNNINDLSPLKNCRKIFPHLRYISLKDNNFVFEQPKNKLILKKLENLSIKNDFTSEN